MTEIIQTQRGALSFSVRDDGDRFVVSEVVDHDGYELIGKGGVAERLADIDRPLTIVDLGANIGAFTCLARALWPTAMIRAVEANAANFQLLDENIARNDIGASVGPPHMIFGATQTLWAAVWDGSTDHAFTHGHGGLAGTSALEPEQGAEVEQVEAVSLDYLLADLDHVDLLKIDTEGAEVPIVIGASAETLSKVGFITGEFHGMTPEWGAWARKLAAFFDLTLRAHPYPDHIWGGMFCGSAR